MWGISAQCQRGFVRRLHVCRNKPNHSSRQATARLFAHPRTYPLHEHLKLAQCFTMCSNLPLRGRCGWPKAQHSADALRPTKPKSSSSLVKQSSESFAAGEAPAERAQFAACKAYVVNIEAATFGECMCGRPKAEHSESALSAKYQPVSRQSSRAVSDDVAPQSGTSSACDKYQINLEAASFGECICGFPKSAHNEAAFGR